MTLKKGESSEKEKGWDWKQVEGEGEGMMRDAISDSGKIRRD